MSLLTKALNLASSKIGGNTSVVLSTEGGSYTGFTEGSWSLSAESTEQTAELKLFTNDIPKGMAYPDLVKGAECTLNVRGLLYITGTISKRKGKTTKKSYELEITVKSKGKALQKSTAKLGQGEQLNTNPEKIIKEIAQNAGIEVKFKDVEAEEIFRHVAIGDRSADREIKAVARDRGYLVYDDHEGKLRVEGEGSGDVSSDLILGTHFEECTVSDSDEKEKGKVKTVGTRNTSPQTNRQATLTPPGEKSMSNKVVGTFIRWVDGDQTPKSLKRRAIFEVNRRVAAGKEAEVKLLGLTLPGGQPVRVNAKHYVEIPTEGLYDVLRLKSASFSFKKEEEEVTLILGPIASLSNKEAKSSGASKAKAALGKKAAGVPSNSKTADWSGTYVAPLE